MPASPLSTIPTSFQPFLAGLVTGFIVAFLLRGFAGLFKWLIIFVVVTAVVILFLSRLQ